MKKAFTLAELVISMSIIGVLATIFTISIRTSGIDAEEYILKANKIINIIEETTLQISQNEPKLVPTGTFLTKSTGTNEFAICTESGCNERNLAEAQDILNLYGKYIKFERTGLNFKEFTNYEDVENLTGDIVGAKIPKDIYIGIEKFSTIGTCGYGEKHTAFIPSDEPQENSRISSEIIIDEKTPCWGRIYIDVDGTKGKGTLGEDVYIFGMGELGIVKN